MQKQGKLKVIVDKKKAADGREFFAAGIRGKFIPKELAKALGAEEERYYAVRPVGASLPQKKGVWGISFSDCWIDKRNPEFQILRLRDPSFQFEKDLLEKDKPLTGYTAAPVDVEGKPLTVDAEEPF